MPIRPSASALSARRSRCLWQMGRGAEQPAVVAEAEAIARRAWRSRDPLPRPPATRRSRDRCRPARCRGRARRRGAPLGRAAGDDWEIAEASREKPSRRPPSPSCASVSTRPPRCSARPATSSDSRNLLDAAAYGALAGGSDRDATDFAARATPIARALDHPFTWMIIYGNVGLVALLTGDTDAARTRSARNSRSAASWSSVPWCSKACAAWPPSPRLTATTRAPPRLVGAAAAHRYDQTRGSRRCQARRDLLRARPHTLRSRRLECRRARRQRPELRGRDRLRPRRTARVAPTPRRTGHATPTLSSQPRHTGRMSATTRCSFCATRQRPGTPGPGEVELQIPKIRSGQLLPGPLPLPVPSKPSSRRSVTAAVSSTRRW